MLSVWSDTRTKLRPKQCIAVVLCSPFGGAATACQSETRNVLPNIHTVFRDKHCVVVHEIGDPLPNLSTYLHVRKNAGLHFWIVLNEYN